MDFTPTKITIVKQNKHAVTSHAVKPTKTLRQHNKTNSVCKKVQPTLPIFISIKRSRATDCPLLTEILTFFLSSVEAEDNYTDPK